MLPQGLRVVEQNAVEEMSSRTYKLDFERKRIIGYVDEYQAMMQAIRKIFETERYAWEIYSHEYGIEFENLIGESMDFVTTALKGRVEEALLADDRVKLIENFEVTQTSKTELLVSCTVVTTQGKLEVREELKF